MLKKIDLPKETTIKECNIKMIAAGNYFIVHSTANDRFIRMTDGILSFDGNRYLYDTADYTGVNMTFAFSSLDNFFKFMLNHDDRNYIDLT